MSIAQTQPKLQFRAQVRDAADTKWVDGALFGRLDDAILTSESLAERYGNPARVIEVRHGHA